MNKVVTLAKSFVNLIYPLHCASCGKPLEALNGSGVCDLCRAQIKRNPAPYCSWCGRSMDCADGICVECEKMRPSFGRAYSACLYEGVLKKLIHAFKYKNKRILSGIFTDLLVDFIGDNPEAVEGIDMITFIPLHRNRSSERGFNQSELLASCLGKAIGVPVIGFMQKSRATKNQNELSREERLVNIRGAFTVKRALRELVEGSGILVIDDVMTTAATLDESSRVLLDAGASRVHCLTLARGL